MVFVESFGAFSADNFDLGHLHPPSIFYRNSLALIASATLAGLILRSAIE
jgi:hypothetical protein